MSDELIVRHCSPTLAGIKTANMFSCEFKDIQEMCKSIRYWNSLLNAKGLRFLPLRFQGNKALLYLYRPYRLWKDLQCETACRLLKEQGYGLQTPNRCLLQLMGRLSECSEFPHEIGLFLGYPPEDVSGFIKNHAKKYKCLGYWKVYGDEQAAKKLFAKYKKCTEVYFAQFRKGKSVEWLTIAEKGWKNHE